MALASFLLVAFILIGIRILDSFILFPKQRFLLTNLSREFEDGYALLEDIYPVGNWDTVCLVPAYSNYTLDGTRDGKSYIGIFRKIFYVRFVSPHTASANYGLGFAFLKQERLQTLIHIQRVQRDIYKDGHWFAANFLTLQVPEYKLHNGARSTTFRFTDMNVIPQNKNQKCYSRKNAYIKFEDYQRISVGSNSQ